MTIAAAEIILIGTAAYFFVGLLYSIYFVVVKASRHDATFKRAKWDVRLLMIPATLLLWPIVAAHGKTNDQNST